MPRRGDYYNGSDAFNKACKQLLPVIDRLYDIGRASACKATIDQILRTYNKEAYVVGVYDPPSVLAAALQRDYPELWEDGGEAILGKLLPK